MHARQSDNFVYSDEFVQRVLDAYTTVPLAALIAAPKVRLFQGEAFHPGHATPLADFTAAVATFTDYVEKTPVIVNPVSLGGRGFAAGAVLDWLMTTDPAVVQNTVRGYYVVDGALLVGFEEWDADSEVQMSGLGSRLVLELLLPFLFVQDIEL